MTASAAAATVLAASVLAPEWQVAPCPAAPIAPAVAPAAAQGFRTALFAGDARSLRKREDDGLTVRPDLILTDLDQLISCLS